MVDIRVATPKDAEALAPLVWQVNKLHEENLVDEFVSGGEENSLRYMKMCLDEKDTIVFVAEIDGQIAGYLILRLREYPKEYFVVTKRGFAESVGVDEKYRGRGVGKALFVLAENWLREQGIRYFDLDYYSFNTAAEKLYEKLGFKELKKYRRKDLK